MNRNETHRPDPIVLAFSQGLFNVVGGGWPIVHLRSFEWIFGPKTDRWLQHTTAGLLAAAGWSQLRAGPDLGSLAVARRVGVGTAATLLAIDLVYVPRRRIRPTYLLDAAMQVGWLYAWSRCGPLGNRPRTPRRGTRCRH